MRRSTRLIKGQDLTPEAVWQCSGWSQDRMRTRFGIGKEALSKRIKEMGFERVPPLNKGHFRKGPCLGCGEQFDVEDLDGFHLCLACVPPAPPDIRILHRERRLRDKRAKERDEGELARPYTTTAWGHKVGGAPIRRFT